VGSTVIVDAPPRVYLDANVFITAFEHGGAGSEHAWWIIRAIETGDIEAGTSEITLAEVLVKPLERGQSDLVGAYEKMISPGSRFEVIPVRRDILVNAATLRARRNAVRLPDAVHVATARALGCHFFVGNDRRIPVPEGMRMLSITPFTLDDILAGRK
jgi:predicted nucleic acid-binding protein